MEQLIDSSYINEKEKLLCEKFIHSNSIKKYILGINSLTKSVQKHVQVDGIIDDFTRFQSSKKKNILNINDIDADIDCIILSTASASPLEVRDTLDKMGFTHLSYLALFKYSNLDLKSTAFIADFEEDFKNNYNEYEYTYNLLQDLQSKDIFMKVINFKISFDYDFMNGFTNNHDGQYFDKNILPKFDDIVFLDGGAYIGDTLPNIIKNYPNYKKIYCVEPNKLHISIARKNYSNHENIEFINCGLGNKKVTAEEITDIHYNCHHDYQALNINTIDNLIQEKIDFIKLDIEGAEQDTIKGAKNTIQKYTPVLAICIYHKAEDWYKIPKMVLAINSNYSIYLRHYMEGIYETVMYFIPKN